MDTQKVKSSSENAGADSKSARLGKMKQVARTAAQFVGAAGMGVAGAMAVQAMDTEVTAERPQVILDTPEAGEIVAEEPEPFDPADIMIEEVEEVTLDEGKPEETHEATAEAEDLAAQATQGYIGEITIDEPEPITGDVQMEADVSGEVAMVDVNEVTNELIGADADTVGYLAEETPETGDGLIDIDGYGQEVNPEIWEEEVLPNDDILFADNDASTSAGPDILDDILNV